MNTDAFNEVVTSERELRAIIGEPSELARKKQLAALDAHCRAFIARSPFLLLATANTRGECDVSPKGDVPGFVLVLDDHRLVIPDRPGNRRLDGMKNLLENPHVGLIFLIPGKEETLRVNGRGWIVREAELLERTAIMGKRPRLAIGVEVEECFLHCAKAFKRAKLWDAAHWPAPADLASMAQMLLDQTKPAGQTVEDLERHIQEGYAQRLY
ncbi:MAG: pyridoxamine 5'-phosphate oxidase family protein [Candidatus Rokuibacteriota bacterium]